VLAWQLQQDVECFGVGRILKCIPRTDTEASSFQHQQESEAADTQSGFGMKHMMNGTEQAKQRDLDNDLTGKLWIVFVISVEHPCDELNVRTSCLELFDTCLRLWPHNTEPDPS
jgi:hypothetical protein